MSEVDSECSDFLEPRIIREHLATVLGSARFSKSHKLSAFLTFVVEHRLTRREDDIQEYTIGIEVFGRKESFDPRYDSIVRVEAHRLRERLAEFYSKEGRGTPIRIVLPGRGYVPRFERRNGAIRGLLKVALGVAVALLLGILIYSTPRVPPHHVPNEAAREAFAKGVLSWRQWTNESSLQAQQYFEQAIAYDPDYALPYAWLSASHRQQATMGDANPQVAHASARAAAEKALALDPRLPEAYHSQAVNLSYQRDWGSSERAFRKAIQLEPENPDFHHAYGIVLMAASPARLDEAEAELRKAASLRPADLGHLVVLGKILYFRGRYREARSLIEEALAIRRYYPDAMRNLAAVLLQTGEQQEAVRLLEVAQSISAHPWGDGLLGHALAVSGDRERARTILADLEHRYRQKPNTALSIAAIEAGLEEYTPACEWLQKAWDDFDMRARYMTVDPIFRSLRTQPCFSMVLEKSGLSDLDAPTQ